MMKFITFIRYNSNKQQMFITSHVTLQCGSCRMQMAWSRCIALWKLMTVLVQTTIVVVGHNRNHPIIAKGKISAMSKSNMWTNGPQWLIHLNVLLIFLERLRFQWLCLHSIHFCLELGINSGLSQPPHPAIVSWLFICYNQWCSRRWWPHHLCWSRSWGRTDLPCSSLAICN